MVEICKFETIKLSDIISDIDLKNYYNSKIQSFTCLNKDVETFLKDKATPYEQRSKSCTYLVTNHMKDKIIAYYTLSLKSVDFNINVSKTTIKEIDGFSKSINSVAVILIGQLGKNYNYQDMISGDELLMLALGSIYNAKNILGGRICLLETEDTEDNQKVIDFYANNGFKVLQHDKTDKFLQMFRKL